MSRRKGSKNRTTLEKELAKAGCQDPSKLSYKELSSKVVEVKIPEPTPPRIFVEKTIIDPVQAKTIVDDTRQKFNLMVEYYTSADDVGMPGEGAFVPERVHEYLRSKVFFASTIEEARSYAKKSLDKLRIHLLVLWSSKRISGPNDDRNVENRARKADKWADRLEKLGKDEDAKKQRERAQTIRNTPRRGIEI